MGRTGETETGAAESLKMASEGKYKALIDRILPLSEAVRAHELVEARTGIGKVVLEPTRLS
jgi:NADPH:quinone reductase-like Zn-dependent oxidoreductase